MDCDVKIKCNKYLGMKEVKDHHDIASPPNPPPLIWVGNRQDNRLRSPFAGSSARVRVPRSRSSQLVRGCSPTPNITERVHPGLLQPLVKLGRWLWCTFFIKQYETVVKSVSTALRCTSLLRSSFIVVATPDDLMYDTTFLYCLWFWEETNLCEDVSAVWPVFSRRKLSSNRLLDF
jgi:hypothetical protein